jgi:hypothetical protein
MQGYWSRMEMQVLIFLWMKRRRHETTFKGVLINDNVSKQLYFKEQSSVIIKRTAAGGLTKPEEYFDI